MTWDELDQEPPEAPTWESLDQEPPEAPTWESLASESPVEDDAPRNVTFGNAWSGLGKLGESDLLSTALPAAGLPGQVASYIYRGAKNWGDLTPDEKASTKGLTVPLAGGVALAPFITAGAASSAAAIGGYTGAQMLAGAGMRTAGEYFANPKDGLGNAVYEATVGSPGLMAIDAALGPIGSGLYSQTFGAGAKAAAARAIGPLGKIPGSGVRGSAANTVKGAKEVIGDMAGAAGKRLGRKGRIPDSELTMRVPASDAIDPRIPVAPGETPLPSSDHVRYYHYTGGAAEEINRDGIRIANAKGETYGEPNQIWASTEPPESNKDFLEFIIRKDDPRIGGTIKPGAGDTQATFIGDILPEEIVAMHTAEKQLLTKILRDPRHADRIRDWPANKESFKHIDLEQGAPDGPAARALAQARLILSPADPLVSPPAEILTRMRQARGRVTDSGKALDENGKPILSVEAVQVPAVAEEVAPTGALAKLDAIVKKVGGLDADGELVPSLPSEIAKEISEFWQRNKSPIAALRHGAIGGEASIIPKTEADFFAHAQALAQDGVSTRNWVEGDLQGMVRSLLQKFEATGHGGLLRAPKVAKGAVPEPSPVFHYLSGETINGRTAAEAGAGLPAEVRRLLDDDNAFGQVTDYIWQASRLAGKEQIHSPKQLVKMVEDDPGVLTRRVGPNNEPQLPPELTLEKLQDLEELAELSFIKGEAGKPGVYDARGLEAFNQAVEGMPGVTTYSDSALGAPRIGIPLMYRPNYMPLSPVKSELTKEARLIAANAELKPAARRTQGEIYESAAKQRIPDRTGRPRKDSPEEGLDPKRFNMDFRDLILRLPASAADEVADLASWGSRNGRRSVVEVPGYGGSMAEANVGNVAKRIHEQLSDTGPRAVFTKMLADKAKRGDGDYLVTDGVWDRTRNAISNIMLPKSFLTSQLERAKQSWVSGTAAKRGGQQWIESNPELARRIANSANATSSPREAFLTSAAGSTKRAAAAMGQAGKLTGGRVNSIRQYLKDPLSTMGREEVQNRIDLVGVNAYWMADLMKRLSVPHTVMGAGKKAAPRAVPTPTMAEFYEASTMLPNTGHRIDGGEAAVARLRSEWEKGNGSFSEEFYKEVIGNLQRHQMYGMDMETMPSMLMTPAGKLAIQFKPYAIKAQNQFYHDILVPLTTKAAKRADGTLDNSMQELARRRLLDMAMPTTIAGLKKFLLGSALLGGSVLDALEPGVENPLAHFAQSAAKKTLTNASMTAGMAVESGAALAGVLGGSTGDLESLITPPVSSASGQSLDTGSNLINDIIGFNVAAPFTDDPEDSILPPVTENPWPTAKAGLKAASLVAPAMGHPAVNVFNQLGGNIFDLLAKRREADLRKSPPPEPPAFKMPRNR